MKHSVKNLCLKFGAKKNKEREYQLKTTIGTLTIVDLNDTTFIPMMFGKDFNREEWLRVSHDASVGEWSYKWNLHSEDKEFNLGRLEQRLAFINKNFIQL